MKREQRCLAPPAAPATLCVLPWGHWLHQLLWGECKFLSSAPVWKGANGISFSSTWSVYPHDFSYISLLTSWPFVCLKTSLRQQGKCCKPTVRLCSRRAARQAAGSECECASGSDNVWQQQGLRTAYLEVSLCCVLPCSQRTEWKRCYNHQLVFIGGLFVGCADLASAPSGGAWNKSFAGGNALELPTQDIYLAVPWCHNCQWGDSIGCWRPGILPLKSWCSGRAILCTHTISCQDCA